MTGITNSAGIRAFAAISAAYPKGSTLSCTDGKKTIKARNTSGLWLFIIPYAATWTLSCTDGTNTASKAVSITTEGQSVSVELSYLLWLYKDGNEYSDITGGWKEAYFTNSGSYPYTKGTLTKKAESIYMSADTADWRNNISAVTNKKINFDNIESITIHLDSVKVGAESYATFGLTTVNANDNSNIFVNNGPAYVSIREPGEYSVDTTAITGEYYVTVNAQGAIAEFNAIGCKERSAT